jgi:type IV pilus assembly protein PilY1
VTFTLANVNSADFDASPLSQHATWNSTQRGYATAGALVGYLRGQHQFEARTDDDHTDSDKRLFRARSHVLGDVVDSSPVYVKKPPFRYTDSGYAAYVGAQSTRAGTVYVGGNDGMLHAFDATTGAERWAYIPKMLHSQLFRLADAAYANKHRYFVNGPITVGDAFDGTNWRTVLIAGLGGGGKGYFALDVTDPTNPLVLWEYTNANLGFTYGNPVLTKRASDGTWVVLFTSGYQKVDDPDDSWDNDTSDGKGRLFMVDAFTGTAIGTPIATTGTDPNLTGIAKITNWVLDTVIDNTTQYVYGGDLSGNLWRFDINSLTAQKMGQTSATAGAMPITARPEVARIRDTSGSYFRVIYVGTGRYLGGTDVAGGSLPETTQQVLLAVKDTGADQGTLTAGTTLVEQTLDADADPRTIPDPKPVNWASQSGWFVKIPLGERVTIEPRLQLGTVSFVANNPVDDWCALGGSSWLYALDYRSGGAISTSSTYVVGTKVDEKTIGTGLTIIRLPNGKLIAIVNTPTGTKTMPLPTQAAGAGSVRRVGYREIN